MVQSKWLKKIDIASKVKLDDEERRRLVSFFFTNFPDSLKAWDMFHLFSIHGRVMEVVIPGLKEGRRKRFGFVRFKDVRDPELMAIKLDNVFIRGIKLHVNMPRFDREVRVEVGAKKVLVERECGTKKVLGECDRGSIGVSRKKDYSAQHQQHSGIKNQPEIVNKVWAKKRDNGVEDVRGCLFSFNAEEDTMARLRKAMVGEVVWPGKSYAIQDEFAMQGVFSIKATPLGANWVLLEGAKDEEDFMEFVEEAKDWLFQWFRWIRPWKPEDVDRERVAWIRCFGVPVHAWNGDFFSKLSEHVGTYLYSDDNTERKKSLDVARVLIRTKSMESLSKTFTVSINNVLYPIKIVEDWCGPLQWSQPVEKDKNTEESSDSECWSKEEEWRDVEGVEGRSLDDDFEEDDVGGDDDLHAIMSQHQSRSNGLNCIDKAKMANNDKISTALPEGVFVSSDNGNDLNTFSKSESRSTRVNDTFSSNMDKAHDLSLGLDGESEGGRTEKGVMSSAGAEPVNGSRPSVSPTLDLPSIHVEPTPVDPGEYRILTRKEKKYLSVSLPKKMRAGLKPQKVVRNLAEVSGKEFHGSQAPEVEERANSSSLFSAGAVLCDGSIDSSDIRGCNNKFWALQSKAVARRVWETAKNLGVEGIRPEEVYIEEISQGEKRDEIARKKGKNAAGSR